MRMLVVGLLLFSLSGCANGSERIPRWVKDPHYTRHLEKMDDLERSRLAGEVSYVEYLEKKKQLESQYDDEVKKREDTIHAQPPSVAP